MLDEAHGSGKIIKEPAETAIIEVDDAQVISLHQEIGEAQIGMHQSETLRACAEPLDPQINQFQCLLENRDTGMIQSDGCTPRSPVAVRAHHGIDVPPFAAES